MFYEQSADSLPNEKFKPFALMRTSRGYFMDIFGVDKPVYVLRRPESSGPFDHLAHSPHKPLNDNEPMCWGRQWDLEAGTVSDAELPDYPARGKMLGAGDTIVFPSREFHFELEDWHLDFDSERSVDDSDACVGSKSGVSVDVMGVDSPAPAFHRNSEDVKALYEKLQKQARENAKTAIAWASQSTPVDRKWKHVRFSSTCALDVAQVAAQLYVYGRTLGASSDEAIAEADAAMKGSQLAGKCWGIGVNSSDDGWPKVRAALVAAKIEPISIGAPSTAASASEGTQADAGADAPSTVSSADAAPTGDAGGGAPRKGACACNTAGTHDGYPSGVWMSAGLAAAAGLRRRRTRSLRA
jgi:MYXO-CTERM domain-containing protein